MEQEREQQRQAIAELKVSMLGNLERGAWALAWALTRLRRKFEP